MKLKRYSEKFNELKNESRNHGELDSAEMDELRKLHKRFYDKKHDMGIVNEEDEDYVAPEKGEKAEFSIGKDNPNIQDKEPTDDDIKLAGKSLEELMEGEEEEDGEDEETKSTDKEYSKEDRNSDMENLSYLIRQLFKNSDIEAEVIYEELDIDIYVFLHKREKIKPLLKVFDTIMKLKKDILPQYESSVELYESKEKWPILQFRFEYKDGTTASKKSDPLALPPSTVTPKQTKMFGDDEQLDLSTRSDSDSNLPF